MMLLIGNGRILTRDCSAPFFDNGAVLIDGDRIKEVGSSAVLRGKWPETEFIDAKGALVMPALVNAHEHIYSALARGLAIEGYHPGSFREILEGLWWNIDRHMQLEDVAASAEVVLIDCIKNGVTTIFDHHASYGAVGGSLETIAEAAKRLGLRACLCYEVSDREGEAAARDAVRENADFIRAAEHEPMLKGMMGLHASFTLSDKTLEACRAAAPEDAGFHIHVCEGPDDQADSLQKYGMRTVERLALRGVLNRRSMAGHCIHLDEHEMDILAESGATMVYNPESNMGNAVGAPPLPLLIEHGVRAALGTDGYTNDMLESYKVAPLLQKHSLRDAAAGGEAGKMLFETNAVLASERFGVELGVLKTGAAADLIITDYIPTTPLSADNADYHILFGVTGRSVVTTICAGRVLMQDRVLKTADEAAATALSRERAVLLGQKINGNK